MLVFYIYDETGDHIDTVAEQWITEFYAEGGCTYEEVFRADLGD